MPTLLRGWSGLNFRSEAAAARWCSGEFRERLERGRRFPDGRFACFHVVAFALR
jgi:hypothetical protein